MPRTSKQGVAVRIEQHEPGLGGEVKEIFIGHRTVFSLIGFTVGGILVGRTLWEFGRIHLGLVPTLLLGIVIFTISGLLSGQFRR